MSVQGYIFDQVPDDIEPSHIVMGSKNYYTTMPYSSNRYIVVIGIILMILFVILLLAFGFYYSAEKFNLEIIDNPPPNNPQKVDLRQGAGVNQNIAYSSNHDGDALNSHILCSNPDVSFWASGSSRCMCKPPYWGSNCLRESFKPQYIGLGQVDPSTVTINTIGTPVILDRLSYPKTPGTSCTDICDSTSGCKGVWWNRNSEAVGGECTLFSSIAPKSNFVFNFDRNYDSNFYVNDPLTVFEFSDKVIVYSTVTAPVWWQDVNAKLLSRGQQYVLNFYPQHVYNATPMTGVYSIVQFNPADFQDLVNQGDTQTVYINPPGQPLQVPLAWHSEPIWVVYDFTS